MNDIQILRHSNRVCLITLAPTHPVIAQKLKVSSVSFKVTDKLDRGDNKVSGKRKRGAQWLNSESMLCKINCVNGGVYNIYAGIRGSLIEMNMNLLDDPNIINQSLQLEEGYIAIVMPKLHEADKLMTTLLNQDQYDQYKDHVLNVVEK